MQKEETGQTTAQDNNAGDEDKERQKRGGARGSEPNDSSASEELGTVAIADNLPKGDPDKGSHRLQ